MGSNDFSDFYRKVRRAAEDINAAMRPIVQMQQKIAADMQPVMNALAQQHALFDDITNSLKVVQSQMAPVIEQVSRAYEKLPAKNREALRSLAMNGWYLDPDITLPDLFELAHELEFGNRDAANERLCLHFEKRLDEIESQLNARFPHREHISKAMFKAHRRDDFTLSIPIMLSQADGICQELTGVQLYSRLNGVPQLATYLHIEYKPPFQASLLIPLVENAPITAGPTERAAMENILNRHAILHGEAVDYNSRLNSCRAISLLVYVVWALDEEDIEAD